MPNWNYNVAKVSHADESLVNKFITGCKTGLFTEFLPIPEDDKEEWYGWNIANWGTKWDVEGIDCQIDENGVITVTFDTAWSPPIAFYEHLVELGFTVTAYYYEPGLGFCGIYDESGDSYYEIGDLSGDEVQELIPHELNEMFIISQEKWDYEAENEEIELEDSGTDEEMTEEELVEATKQLEEAFAELESEQNSAKDIARQGILSAISNLQSALDALDTEE